MNFLIIDDERLARAELRREISALLPSFHFVEASNVAQAREAILSHAIDGVFLDLEMPGGHGMGFVPELRSQGIPVVITTAHDRYALEAFDVDVADYLLKPIEQSRLVRAIAKMRKKEPKAGEGLVVFSDQNHCWPIPLDDLIMAESEGSYVTLQVRNRKPIVLCRTLKDIETMLPEKDFIRVSRSQIVRLQCLRSIQRKEGGTFSAELEGGGTVVFSRRQAQAFRQRFGV